MSVRLQPVSALHWEIITTTACTQRVSYVSKRRRCDKRAPHLLHGVHVALALHDLLLRRRGRKVGLLDRRWGC